MNKIFSAKCGSAYGGKNKKGFSLIELLIAIAIIGIITSVTIVSMGDRKRDAEVEVAARKVVAAIRQAQNNALAGKGASSSCSQYNFTYGSSGYSMDCSGNYSVSHTLENGITFANASANTVSFSVPFGTLNPASDTTIQLTKNSSTYYICVNKGGDVSEVKNLPCPS
ncbi:MAG: prepilin-type N-terminal cleavage/methylation domain-containing protein [Parcubacteria group bacterium]|jgi:prepilin-type N-terminal cleavage/methylation domain-containing protein